MNYNDLSSFVQEEEKLEFLHQIVPKKITVKEFREIIERGSESESSDSEDEATSNEENSDEEIEEEEDGMLDKKIFTMRIRKFSNIFLSFMIFSEYLDLFPIILIFAHVSCFF